MLTSKADIVAQLQRSIASLQGFKPVGRHVADTGLGAINNAFPNATFPLGAVHEFLCEQASDVACSTGFIAGILSSLMRTSGVSLWISSSRTLFPPALKQFRIDPARIIFIDGRKEKDVLWAMEEALKCNGLVSVIGEMKELDFTSSRRLQLAVEQSRVTGFILRHTPKLVNPTACVSRWKITSLPSISNDGMPGVSFPQWNVQLLKIRNGKPGEWQLEWVKGRFTHIFKQVIPQQELQRKTG